MSSRVIKESEDGYRRGVWARSSFYKPDLRGQNVTSSAGCSPVEMQAGGSEEGGGRRGGAVRNGGESVIYTVIDGYIDVSIRGY